jgi:hypothetical protein
LSALFALALVFTVSLTPVGGAAQALQGAPPPPEELSLEMRVEGTMARGIAWLKRKQSRDGSWPGHEEKHPGGFTALSCFTLVKAGVGADDPALLAGLRSISSVHFKSTYSAAVDLMLFAALREIRAPAGTRLPFEDALEGADPRPSFDLLVATHRDGLWGYPEDPIDMSNTQFALLGLRAGAQLGYAVPDKLLERSAAALLKQQDDSGGFGYHPGEAERGGMTAATLGGVAVITELAHGNTEILGPFAKKRDRLRAAEAWMEARFDVAHQAFGQHGWTPTFENEYLWAVERWCGLSGKTKIGAHDWYREGAEYLLAEQGIGGDWDESVENTCFALFFLRRATMTGWEDRSALYERLDREKRRAQEKPKLSADPGVHRITDWLVAGPYRDEKGNPAFQATDLARFRPRERKKFQDKSFEALTLKADAWTDLEIATGRGGDHIDWIAATTLTWRPPPGRSGEKESLDGILWFAFEDAWKVWLDGKLVSSEMRMASPIVEDVQIPVALEPGEHALVVLVADHVGASAFSGRITDRSGKAMPAGFTAGVPRK